jgi:hypothetical protein
MITSVIITSLFCLNELCLYETTTINATVTDIEYIGIGSISGYDKVILSLDDGSVYSLYDIPSTVKLNHDYTFEFHTPYIFGGIKLYNAIERIESENNG